MGLWPARAWTLRRAFSPTRDSSTRRKVAVFAACGELADARGGLLLAWVALPPKKWEMFIFSFWCSPTLGLTKFEWPKCSISPSLRKVGSCLIVTAWASLRRSPQNEAARLRWKAPAFQRFLGVWSNRIPGSGRFC